MRISKIRLVGDCFWHVHHSSFLMGLFFPAVNQWMKPQVRSLQQHHGHVQAAGPGTGTGAGSVTGALAG